MPDSTVHIQISKEPKPFTLYTIDSRKPNILCFRTSVLEDL